MKHDEVQNDFQQNTSQHFFREAINDNQMYTGHYEQQSDQVMCELPKLSKQDSNQLEIDAKPSNDSTRVSESSKRSLPIYNNNIQKNSHNIMEKYMGINPTNSLALKGGARGQADQVLIGAHENKIAREIRPIRRPIQHSSLISQSPLVHSDGKISRCEVPTPFQLISPQKDERESIGSSSSKMSIQKFRIEKLEFSERKYSIYVDKESENQPLSSETRRKGIAQKEQQIPMPELGGGLNLNQRRTINNNFGGEDIRQYNFCIIKPNQTRHNRIEGTGSKLSEYASSKKKSSKKRPLEIIYKQD